MNDRTCIVTRQRGEPEGLLRFVAGPDGSVVPDIKRNLPGRGCWVTADRTHVDRAVKKKLFARALKAEVTVSPELGQMVDRLLVTAALGALGLARKAGAAVLGAAKVESAVRSGKATAVLHAYEAAPDGIRKLAQARRAVVFADGPDIPAYKLFSQAELGLALGATNVIHAALIQGDAARGALRRMDALDRYRGGSPDDRNTVAAVPEREAAEDTE